MGRPTIKFKFKLSRGMLVRLLSQQLATDWRGRPDSREECLARASNYLTGLVDGDLKRLRQLYEGSPDEEVPGSDDSWRLAHRDGLKFREQAEETVEEFYPELSPQGSAAGRSSSDGGR
jgi:hypothetical protein